MPSYFGRSGRKHRRSLSRLPLHKSDWDLHGMFPAGPILAALAGMGIGRVTGGLVGALAGAVFREYEAEIWGNDPGRAAF